mmetsp:Transcript_16926/g.30295  ORF Transcript_16926/g.30295 Transcript_16926/m.30295 type:complete len:1140 (+) Transcript_16926:338-3757(+)
MQLPQPRGDLAHHSFAMNEAGYDSVAQAGMPANYDMIPDPAEAYSRRGNHALPDPMHELTLPGENFAEAMYQNDQDTLIYRRPHPDYRRTPSQGPVVVPLHSLAPSPHMSGRLNDEQSTLVPTSLNEPQGFSMAFRDSSEEVYATSSRAASAPILGGRSTGDGGTGGPIRQNTMEMMTAPRHGPVGTQGGINGTGGMRGSFENSIFKPRYQRNNKRGGLKNLRCFPSCGFRHKEKGFCGRSVEIDLSHPPETSSSRFNTWVEFVRTDEPPRYHLGERVSMDVLLDLERSKDEPIKPLVRGERLDEKCTESSTSFEFNRERRGWHYGWASNKHTCNAQHTLQCYIFEASEHDPNEHVCKLIVRSPSFMLFCRRRRRFTLMPSAPTSAPTKRARSAASANEHAATVKRERLERNDDEDFGNDEDVEDGDEEENVALVTSSTSLSSSLVDSGNVGRLNPQNPADASSSSSSTSSTPLSHQSQGHQHQYPQPSSRGGPSKLPSGKKYHAPTALASSSSSSSLTPQVSPVQSSMQGVVHSQSVPSMPPKVAAQKLPNHSNRSRESQGSTYTAGSIRLGGIGMADSSRAESVFKRLAVIMSRIQQQQQQQQQQHASDVASASSSSMSAPGSTARSSMGPMVMTIPPLTPPMGAGPGSSCTVASRSDPHGSSAIHDPVEIVDGLAPLNDTEEDNEATDDAFNVHVLDALELFTKMPDFGDDPFMFDSVANNEDSFGGAPYSSIEPTSLNHSTTFHHQSQSSRYPPAHGSAHHHQNGETHLTQHQQRHRKHSQHEDGDSQQYHSSSGTSGTIENGYSVQSESHNPSVSTNRLLPGDNVPFPRPLKRTTSEQMIDDVAQYLSNESKFQRALGNITRQAHNGAPDYQGFLRMVQDYLESYRRSRNISRSEFDRVFNNAVNKFQQQHPTRMSGESSVSPSLDAQEPVVTPRQSLLGSAFGALTSFVSTSSSASTGSYSASPDQPLYLEGPGNVRIPNIQGRWRQTEVSENLMQELRVKMGTPWILSKMFEFMESRYEIEIVGLNMVTRLNRKWISNTILRFVLDGEEHAWGISLPAPFSQLSQGWTYRAWIEDHKIILTHMIGDQRVTRINWVSRDRKMLHSIVILEVQDMQTGNYLEMGRVNQHATLEP